MIYRYRRPDRRQRGEKKQQNCCQEKILIFGKKCHESAKILKSVLSLSANILLEAGKSASLPGWGKLKSKLILLYHVYTNKNAGSADFRHHTRLMQAYCCR